MENRYPKLNETLSLIRSIYDIPPTGFVVGNQINMSDENQGSLAILSFARACRLPDEEVLPMFGEAYEEVLGNPDGEDHSNIRALMDLGMSAFFPDVDECIFLKKDLKTIDEAWGVKDSLSPDTVTGDLKDCIDRVIDDLGAGRLRVAMKLGDYWHVNEILKKVVLLSFKINNNKVMDSGVARYFDKVNTKYSDYTLQDFVDDGVRVVPNAMVREGSYVAPGVVLMPSYVNIGAYVGERTMIDTWATVGSCAQIGKNCHISGGAGIGGVLEPLQASPTIIEDDCFIGARSEIVEGVVVEQGSVISMGVHIGQSTKIYNRMTGEVTYGRIPAGSVVVSGNILAKDGSYGLYCAVIIKQVDAKTRAKTSLNDLLRD